MANSRLRRLCGVLLVSTIALLIPAAAALAAHPITSASYSGHGTQYWNNTPNHAYTNRQHSTARISFKVSSSGQRVLDFSGQYSAICLSGVSSVTDHWISVDRTGFFSVSGSYPSYGYNHQRNGTTYATIKGQFTDGGHKAKIFYRVTTKLNGSTQPCGTQVEGTVRPG